MIDSKSCIPFHIVLDAQAKNILPRHIKVAFWTFFSLSPLMANRRRSWLTKSVFLSDFTLCWNVNGAKWNSEHISFNFAMSFASISNILRCIFVHRVGLRADNRKMLYSLNASANPRHWECHHAAIYAAFCWAKLCLQIGAEGAIRRKPRAWMPRPAR